jgi:hypothetical protein
MRLKSRRTAWSTCIAALTMLIAALVVAPANPASAAASDCEYGANGFVDIPDNLVGTVARSRYLQNVDITVTLDHGYVYGAQRGWARISGQTIPGDQVWMDWSVNGGNSIAVRCGPFAVDNYSSSKTSAAKATSWQSTYVFRACAHILGWNGDYCTDWW